MQVRSWLDQKFLEQIETAKANIPQFVQAFSTDPTTIGAEIAELTDLIEKIQRMQIVAPEGYFIDSQGRLVRDARIDDKIFTSLANRIRLLMANANSAPISLQRIFTKLETTLENYIPQFEEKLITSKKVDQLQSQVHELQQGQIEPIAAPRPISVEDVRKQYEVEGTPLELPPTPIAPDAPKRIPAWRYVLPGAAIAFGIVLGLVSLALSATGVGAAVGVPGFAFAIAIIVGVASLTTGSVVLAENARRTRNDKQRYEVEQAAYKKAVEKDNQLRDDYRKMKVVEVRDPKERAEWAQRLKEKAENTEKEKLSETASPLAGFSKEVKLKPSALRRGKKNSEEKENIQLAVTSSAASLKQSQSALNASGSGNVLRVSNSSPVVTASKAGLLARRAASEVKVDSASARPDNKKTK